MSSANRTDDFYTDNVRASSSHAKEVQQDSSYHELEGNAHSAGVAEHDTSFLEVIIGQILDQLLAVNATVLLCEEVDALGKITCMPAK